MLSAGRILLFLLIFFHAQDVFASVQSPSYPKLISAANDLVKKGRWDEAERDYLKAASSPELYDRMAAYEGLAALYKKLKMFKKAGRAEAKLKNEKDFESKLLPESDSYYETYRLKSGDSYGKLASRYGVSERWLMRANKGKALIEGRSVKLPKGRYEIVVSIKDRMLFWKRGSEVIKKYPISVGRKGMETPEGSFKVTSKVAHPVWYHRKKEIPPDSPENLLGTRWLGLDKRGYGIHGTRNPESINEAASHGCVRMYNHDVEELFEWIPVGTRVTIRA